MATQQQIYSWYRDGLVTRSEGLRLSRRTYEHDYVESQVLIQAMIEAMNDVPSHVERFARQKKDDEKEV